MQNANRRGERMLTEERILRVANMAAETAATVLGVDKYTVELTNDPSASEDAFFNTQENNMLSQTLSWHDQAGSPRHKRDLQAASFLRSLPQRAGRNTA